MSIGLIYLFSLIFVSIGYLISSDKLFHLYPKFIRNHEYQFTKTCGEISFLLFLIAISLMLLTTFNIDVVIYYNKLPFHNVYFPLYVFLKFKKATERSKEIDLLISLDDARDEKKSFHYFDYLMITYEGRLSCNDRKLNTLKSFSILPVVLLLLNNFSDTFYSFSKKSHYTPSDYSNIGLVFFILIYIYQTYKCFKLSQYTSSIIVEIKKQRFLFEFPDALKNKVDHSVEIFKNPY